MRPVLFALAVVIASGCGGGGCGGGGGSGRVDLAPDKVFAPKRYKEIAAKIRPLNELTLVLDTAMPPAQLAEAAAGLSAWVDTHAKLYRLRLIETDAKCGPGVVRVDFPPSERDVEAELLEGAAQIKAALAAVQPTTSRSTLGALATQTQGTLRHHREVWLITSGADQCSAEVGAVVGKLAEIALSPRVVAFQSEPSDHAWLNTAAGRSDQWLNCRSGTDAECGAGNFCADPTRGACDRRYLKAGSAADLTDALTLPGSTLDPLPCRQHFFQLEPNQIPSRAFLDGVEVPKGSWSYERLAGISAVTFTGDACDKISASTIFDPVTLEVEVPFSIDSL